MAGKYNKKPNVMATWDNPKPYAVPLVISNIPLVFEAGSNIIEMIKLEQLDPKPVVKKEIEDKKQYVQDFKTLFELFHGTPTDQKIIPVPTPWRPEYDSKDLTPWYFPERQETSDWIPQEDSSPVTKKPPNKKTQIQEPTLLLTSKGVPRIQAKNYSAMEKHKKCGIIDTGPASTGIRGLILHMSKGKNTSNFLQELKIGDILHAYRISDKEPLTLRLRFITPSRYYSPGTKITTLMVGVDERDWSKSIVT